MIKLIENIGEVYLRKLMIALRHSTNPEMENLKKIKRNTINNKIKKIIGIGVDDIVYTLITGTDDDHFRESVVNRIDVLKKDKRIQYF